MPWAAFRSWAAVQERRINAKRSGGSRIVLFGDEAKIKAVLEERRKAAPRSAYDIVAMEVIEMGDHPPRPFRPKADSETYGRVRLSGQRRHRRFCQRRQYGRHDGRLDVCGKTDRRGHRPTIVHRSHDCGASRASAGRGAERGLQARSAGAVGSIYAEAVLGIGKPRVAVLNIGEEGQRATPRPRRPTNC